MARCRPVLMAVAALALASAVVASPATTGQGRSADVDGQTAADPETAPLPAPVLVGGEPVIWIGASAGPYTAQDRAARIGRRLEEAIHDRSIRDPTVTVTESEGSSELRVGPRLILVVTARDAAGVGGARASLAQYYARELETAIRAERLRYAPAALLRSGIYGLVATMALVAVLWGIRRLGRGLLQGLARRLAARAEALRAIDSPHLTLERLTVGLRRAIQGVRLVLVLLAFDLYLTYVLGLFPWTRAVSARLLDYVLAPVRVVTAAFIGYLPKLLFLIVIAAFFYSAIRVVAFFFRQIGAGRLTIARFPPEWADPTNKIVRFLLIAFGLVVAFPYLPASDSPAFTGVSVFMGVLVSLASSSALSNMIAGIVLTYTGAFRLGDRVKIGDAFGDIVETSLLATRIRTIKNEEVTIPNSIALGSAVTNYTREARTLGLILHTSVTIGYDAPWRKVHDLLVGAARATPGVLHDPRPFVWQTSLNDFYVTYEINAYTRSAREMIDIYAALHANIQDSFYAAGVEIMSPHVTAIRDGNAVAIPEALRPRDYEAPSFRVEQRTRAGV